MNEVQSLKGDVKAKRGTKDDSDEFWQPVRFFFSQLSIKTFCAFIRQGFYGEQTMKVCKAVF